MIIAVPSKGRAGLTTTNKIFKNSATFFIPKSEYHQYKSIVKNIECVPNEVQGITSTRNYILNNSNDKRVVMLDDDIKKIGYVKRNERNVNHINLKKYDEYFWIDEFNKYFELTEQLNYKIWGVTTDDSTRSAYSYKPIMFKTYALGSIMGIINDKEYLFDESFLVKEDYEICLRHIKNKGGILGIKYLYWANKHYKDAGGCKDYRTVNMEKECIKKLINLYPSMIAKVKRKGTEFGITLTM
tara:strand:- start:1035 stop:1760 length:726 start_codon:yes stop_codon:yes gene_type:complete